MTREQILKALEEVEQSWADAADVHKIAEGWPRRNVSNALANLRVMLTASPPAPAEGEREGLVTCDLYRHGATLALLHVPTAECVHPVPRPAPRPPSSPDPARCRCGDLTIVPPYPGCPVHDPAPSPDPGERPPTHPCICGHAHLAGADGEDGGCKDGDCTCCRWRCDHLLLPGNGTCTRCGLRTEEVQCHAQGCARIPEDGSDFCFRHKGLPPVPAPSPDPGARLARKRCMVCEDTGRVWFEGASRPCDSCAGRAGRTTP